jgi:hypothetical protein
MATARQAPTLGWMISPAILDSNLSLAENGGNESGLAARANFYY